MDQEEAKCGLHLRSVTKLRITGVSNIRRTVEVDPNGLEHSLSSFPPNLLCPPGEKTKKEGLTASGCQARSKRVKPGQTE